MAASNVLLYTDFKDLKLLRRGKVRDIYELGQDLLIVSTDRISCFDVVLPCGIPFKGEILTRISCFWFDFIKGILPHHLISADIKGYPEILQKYKPELIGRSMLVKKTKPLPLECIVRGYLSGSGWKEYQKDSSICGIKLPAGLLESEKLTPPIFTPSTKEDKGHDINVSEAFIQGKLGQKVAAKLKELSIAVYEKAATYAKVRGIIIADTKFEFGVYGNDLMLIDEVLTPDSSRFWPLSSYRPGFTQPSFDKQFVRDYLESLNWDKTLPAPGLPEEIIENTSRKYMEAYERITGKKLNG